MTAIAGDPQRNVDFYTSVLELRLVKLATNLPGFTIGVKPDELGTRLML
jgi:catechol 2,3-dioxygenase-like lactoylglutathione lyase family enzyme